MGLYSAGESVVSFCTRCKLCLDHVITAMDGETIAKVKCRTCGSVHKYRDPALVKKPRTSKKKAVVPAGVLWQACMAQARGKELVYNMTGRYCVGDIVIHEKFGKGVVRKLDTNKCHIVFQDKERLMASAN